MRSGEDTVEDSGVSEAERTRISSAKLLSSPSRALTASKSNTNWRQQAQCYWGRCAFHGQAREGVAAHLRERGLCSLVWCFQRGEDPACGQDKQDGQQTGAPGCERNGAPGVLILVPACGISLSGACRNSVGRPQVDTAKCGTSPDQGKPA